MNNLLTRINSFVAEYLKDFPADSKKSKFVHDPIWGTIELYDHELRILDTPLLQRLRQIHQTGFVFETYPSAQHTRFEHTLGVIQLASKMANALKKRYPNDISGDTEIIVRLAALMHDVGHSAFSHTTEEIYMECSDIKQLISKGGDFEDKGAGEVISYLIVTSDAFKEYFNELKNDCERIRNIEIHDFANLIIGKYKGIDTYLAEIISGSFDADKLDYFPRDGRAVGIELSIDIDRLLHCIEKVFHNEKNILVVTSGGYNALQQLLFARATLFASVYHHHKVRACDSMVKACFYNYIENKKAFKRTKTFPRGFKLKSAADYLYITDFDFFAEANLYKPNTFEHKIIHDILYRRLFKRVLIISTATIENFSTNSVVKAGYSEFYNLRSNPGKLRELSEEIWKYAKPKCSKRYIAIDILKEPNFNKAGYSLINRSKILNKPDIVALSDVIPIKEWVDTYKQYYAQSYVFGPQDKEDRKKISNAAKEILFNKFGFELNQYASPVDLIE